MNYYLLLILFLLVVPVSADRINTTILARGDSISLDMGTENPASLWLFSINGLDHIYDVNSTRHDVNKSGSYYIDVSAKQSQSLDAGYYTAITQYYGANQIKEARYAERYNYTTYTYDNPIVDEYLASPFKAIPDVPLNGLQPHMVMAELKKMLISSDDVLVESNFTVEDPRTEIHEIAEVANDTVYIYGLSNLKVGTPISIIWDAERQVTRQDFTFNTFKTEVKAGNATLGEEQNRWFDLRINVSIQDLPPGKHWVEVVANEHTTRYAYNVGEIWQNQSPPPREKIKYLNNGVIVTPTPERVEVPGPERTVEVIRTVIQIQTTPPFPKDALGNEYNPFTVQNVSWLGIPALAVIILLMAVKKVWDVKKK